MNNQFTQAVYQFRSRAARWWEGSSRRSRFGVITAGVALVTVAVLGAAGWDNPALTGASGSNQIHGNLVSATLPTAYPSVPATPTLGVTNKIDASTGLKVNFTIDSDGMVEMPVTANPREAAAAAAAIMYSVDMTKVKDALDYREKAIARMTIPSPKYVGPGSQVQLWGGLTNTLKAGEYVSAYESMMAAVNYLAPSSGARVSGMWRGENWTLMFPDVYAGMAKAGTRWVAKPLQVLNYEELKPLNPGDDLNSFRKLQMSNEVGYIYDFAPDEPGATFDEYYVQLSVDKFSAAGDVVTEPDTVSVLIWCDAPAKGGLCGVGMFDPIDWRLNWPRLQ